MYEYYQKFSKKIKTDNDNKYNIRNLPWDFENIIEIENLTDDEKLNIFDDELEMISDIDVRKLTKEILLEVPEKFWYYPNLSEYDKTNKDEEGVGGIVLHTKRAFEIASILTQSWELTDLQRSIVFSAVLLHDSYLDSYNNNIHYHLINPRLNFNEYQYSFHDKKVFDEIMRGIEGHMGNQCVIPGLATLSNHYLNIVHMSDRVANIKGGD